MVELMLATLVAGAAPMTNETKPDLVPLRVRVYATCRSMKPRCGPRWRSRVGCWPRPASSWPGGCARRRTHARSRTRQRRKSSSSFRLAIGRTAARTAVLAAHGARDSAGTVIASVPCLAGVAFRLTRRAGLGTNPLLAMPRHDDLVGAIVAHEIGHVLGIRHAPSGLMRASLEAGDIIALRRGKLGFSPAEARGMRIAASLAGEDTQARGVHVAPRLIGVGLGRLHSSA